VSIAASISIGAVATEAYRVAVFEAKEVVAAKEVLRTICTTAYANREPFLYLVCQQHQVIIQEEQQQ